MKITAVMLHWKRPENVQRIVREWLSIPFIDDYIVLSNTGELPPLGDKVTQVIASHDLGLRSRFLAALVAKNPCILMQDDDILLSGSTVASLLSSWQIRPTILHGLFGRHPKADGSYAKLVDKTEAKVDVVLTRALLMPRDYASHYFQHEHNFPMLASGVPVGNGEDIVLSYLAKAYSGKQNEVHKLAYKELPAPGAIHHRSISHWEHRTRVMRAASHWCQQNNPVLQK